MSCAGAAIGSARRQLSRHQSPSLRLIQIHSYEDLFNQLSLAEKEIPEIENRISDIQKLILSRNTNIEKIDHELNDYDIKKKSAPEIKSEVEKLQNDFEIVQRIDLAPFDKDHAMIIARSIS